MATVVNIHTQAPGGEKYIVVAAVVAEMIHFPSPDFTSEGLSNRRAVATCQIFYP